MNHEYFEELIFREAENEPNSRRTYRNAVTVPLCGRTGSR